MDSIGYFLFVLLKNGFATLAADDNLQIGMASRLEVSDFDLKLFEPGADNLELILHEGLTEALIPNLQAGSLDLVIAAAPLNASGLKEKKLFQELDKALSSKVPPPGAH